MRFPHRNIHLDDNSYYVFKFLVGFGLFVGFFELLKLLENLILVVVDLQAYVEILEVRVKEHEDYNSDLQEGEKWLLHMSSRLVSPDLVESNNLEIITQQLANHKVGFLLVISLYKIEFFFFAFLSSFQSSKYLSFICFISYCWVNKHQCH